MRIFRDRRTSILATVTGISVGIAGVLLFVRFGPVAGPTSPPPPDPVVAGHEKTQSPNPRRTGLPSLPGWLPGSANPKTSASQSSDVPHANAPTDNLRILATALRLKHKSTTGVLTVRAGLNLTATVEISMLWDELGPRPTRATQDYNDTTGNRSVFLFPTGNGSTRKVANVITLAERAANGETTAVYAVRSDVTIEPLYDVTVSALQFKLVTGCDVVGASEVRLYVRFVDNQVGEYGMSTYEGNVHTFTDFGRVLQEVGQSSRFVKPVVMFTELDHTSFPNKIPAAGEPLLPGTDYTFDKLVSKPSDQSCQAGIKYSVTYRLREYLYLD